MNEHEFNHGPDIDGHKEVFRALAKSSTYRNYANDFGRITGLPVSLTPVESWQLAHHNQTRRSPFCVLLATRGPACAACLRTQHKLAQVAAQSARTVECVHGLCETAVPVRAGERLIGFVRTGQVFRHAPTSAGFERVRKRLARWGVTLNAAKLRKAYFATRVITSAQYRSAVGLLTFLAEHLSILSNQILLQQTHAELPIIAKAKKFIEAHYDEKLNLTRVAAAVHSSTFYFCKQFKRATGINFNRYVSLLRVEKAKYLLLNPHYRISDIAFGAGFTSLTHFNRLFVRFTGLSPTTYRAQLGAGREGQMGEGSLRRTRNGTRASLSQRFIDDGHVLSIQEPNGRALTESKRQNDFVGTEGRILTVPLPTFEPAKPRDVKINIVRNGVLERCDLPALLSRPRCEQKTTETVEPAPRQSAGKYA